MGNSVYIFLLLLCFATGCGILVPEPESRDRKISVLPEEFASGSTVSNHAARVPLPLKWWSGFESSELNTLIGAAFSGNLDIAAAVTRLRQAREQMIITASAGRLSLDGSAEAGVDKTGRTATGFSVDNSQESYRLGLSASYILDIWGAVSSAEEASRLTYGATAEQLNATSLLISGQIANAWIRYKTVLRERELILEQIETSRKALELLKVRQRAGLSAAVDVYQQQSQVAALERLLPQIDEQRSDLRIQINYLLGAPASAPLPVEIRSEPLPVARPLPECGVPADLLENRPDIRASWFSLLSRDWTVAARKADRFPSLSLSGNLSFDDAEFSDVLKDWYVNLAAGIIVPILDGGERAARVRLAEAQADEAFVNYTDTVLQALLEVEQALARDKTRHSYLSAVEREFELNNRTFEESVNRYRKGLMEYLNVLTALSSRQSSERRALEARSSLVLNRISLYQSLGGGNIFLKDQL
ncbi:MAG: efflux transporter outer membrane subunit [Kiritimatiellia bacterium]